MIELAHIVNERIRRYTSDDSTLVGCNEAPARHWALTDYTEDSVTRVCAELDSEWMFAVITFRGEGKISFSLSQRTWERGDGHSPTMAQVFMAIAHDPRLQAFQGSFIVWLEDGMWDWCQHYSRRAPIMAFGRNVHDSTTFLIPDPAFIGGIAYASEREQSRRHASQIVWEDRRPTVFWRGAATGIGIEGPEWANTARAKLALKAHEIGDRRIVDAKFTRIKHIPQSAIDNLLSLGLVDDEVPFEEFFNYKYVVDADGYHCAWKSLFLKLMTGSVVLKMDSPFEQWYHRCLVPWRHYVPLSHDARDLKELHAWLISHDSEAQEIAREGAECIARVTLQSSLDVVAMAIESALTAYRPS